MVAILSNAVVLVGYVVVAYAVYRMIRILAE